MEDVRSLCPRSVVVNGGKKLYDGGTDELFDAYQTHKKITAQFERETLFTPPENAEVLEQSPHKAVFMIAKEKSGQALSYMTQNYALADISIEEEDIGHVVERIYAAGGEA
jgi:ABC-2 type transport system ATP-binding protein